jgi:hypothetical protein
MEVLRTYRYCSVSSVYNCTSAVGHTSALEVMLATDILYCMYSTVQYLVLNYHYYGVYTIHHKRLKLYK